MFTQFAHELLSLHIDSRILEHSMWHRWLIMEDVPFPQAHFFKKRDKESE